MRLKVNGVGRHVFADKGKKLGEVSAMANRTLEVYLNREYSDNEMRAMHEIIRETIERYLPC